MKKTIILVPILSILITLSVGCGFHPKAHFSPIAYVAKERPKGTINTTNKTPINKEFPRGGFYFGPYNFRPAPDITSYIDQASRGSNTNILRNVDVQLFVPIYWGGILFGFAQSTDVVTSGE